MVVIQVNTPGNLPRGESCSRVRRKGVAGSRTEGMESVSLCMENNQGYYCLPKSRDFQCMEEVLHGETPILDSSESTMQSYGVIPKHGCYIPEKSAGVEEILGGWKDRVGNWDRFERRTDEVKLSAEMSDGASQETLVRLLGPRLKGH